MKYQPLGIKVIGWIETISGGLGSLFCLYNIFFFFWSLYATKKGIDKPLIPGDPSAELLGIGLCPIYAAISAPFLFLLAIGIGILKLRPWARKLHIIIWSIVLIILSLALILQFFTKDLLAVVSLLLSIALVFIPIFYFTRPMIKELFQ